MLLFTFFVPIDVWLALLSGKSSEGLWKIFLFYEPFVYASAFIPSIVANFFKVEMEDGWGILMNWVIKWESKVNRWTYLHRNELISVKSSEPKFIHIMWLSLVPNRVINKLLVSSILISLALLVLVPFNKNFY